jgi:subtilisin family serine protease
MPLPYATEILNLPNMLSYNAALGSQLGIGLVRAWDYLFYKGILLKRFTSAPDWPSSMAALRWIRRPGLRSTAISISRREGRRCNSTRIQVEAGGTTPGASVPGWSIVKPILIRVNSMLGFEVAQGVADAVLLRPPADVINLSIGVGTCGEFCSTFYDGVFTHLSEAVNYARGNNNAVVSASAGNDSESNNNRLDNIPRTLNGVLCVGAIDFTAMRESYVGGSYSGAGSRVSIWAPDCIPTTPDPSSNGKIVTQFCGTSASAPFVAGIVSLMKALNHNLTYDTTRQIPQSTALPSPDPVVKPGYINALGAVMAAARTSPLRSRLRRRRPAPMSLSECL